VNLEHQYRMCEDIMLLSNHLVYNHRLRCGTHDIAHQSLYIPNLVSGLQEYHSHSQISELLLNDRTSCRNSNCWLSSLLNPRFSEIKEFFYFIIFHLLLSQFFYEISNLFSFYFFNVSFNYYWINSRKVIFLDTDNVPALETRPGDLVQNDIEAILVYQVITSLTVLFILINK